MRFKAEITVKLKDEVRDSQGEAVDVVLKRTGLALNSVSRVGKFFSVEFDDVDKISAEKSVNKVCFDLFSNPILEEYEIISLTEIIND